MTQVRVPVHARCDGLVVVFDHESAVVIDKQVADVARFVQAPFIDMDSS
jgi:ATP-dependent Clp protease adapter protein ClpS